MEALVIIPVFFILLMAGMLIFGCVGAIKKIKRQSKEKAYFKEQQELLKK